MSTPPPDPVVLTPAHLRAWPLPAPGGAPGGGRGAGGGGGGGGKDTRGRVLVAGGAASAPGAPLLSATAALRAGAGKVQMAVPASHAVPLSVALPEAGLVALPEVAPGRLDPAGAAETLAEAAAAVDALLLGPGYDDAGTTRDLVEALVPRLPAGLPLVLDAFALGALPQCPAAAHAARGRCLLTPNPAEARRLLELPEPPADAAAAAREIARRYGAVVALRGHVADPDGGLWLEGSGHAGLGTSGSGDVLSGLAAGLLARGAGLTQSACWACALHGTAGDRLAARVGPLGFLARELLDEAPRVLAELHA